MPDKPSRRGRSWYADEDVLHFLNQIQAKYPIHSVNKLVNAAVRYYTPKALNGLDADLIPLADNQNVINEEDVTKKKLIALLTRCKISFEVKREAWTDQQHNEFSVLKAVSPAVTPERVLWDGKTWHVLEK